MKKVLLNNEENIINFCIKTFAKIRNLSHTIKQKKLDKKIIQFISFF